VAGGGRIQSAQDMQKCALPRAGLADNGHHLAGLDIEAEALEKGERGARVRVGFFPDSGPE